MRLVCVDNMILIWGIQNVSRRGQEEKKAEAKHLFQKLDQDGIKVMVPSIVLGEFLAGIPVPRHEEFLRKINGVFQVHTYDFVAARHYARIWQKRKEEGLPGALQDTEKHLAEAERGMTRARMKADSMIVATAMAAQAECIYSHDKGIRAFAKDEIEVRDLPRITGQLDLLEDIDPAEDT